MDIKIGENFVFDRRFASLTVCNVRVMIQHYNAV